MRSFSSNALLAASLFSSSVLTEPQWPHNLPAHAKYYPEDEPAVRRNVEIEKRVLASPPKAIRKMSDDPGAMFFLEYWGLEDEEQQARDLSTNSSMLPAVRLHSSMDGLVPRWFQKRGFTCPSGTNSCSSIDRPNSCCAEGLTCSVVQDSGLGDVGCCADTDNCGGASSECPADYTSCPNDGGGCCIPGYACQGVGCVLTSTTVVVVTPIPPATSRPPSTSSPSTTTFSSTSISSSSESAITTSSTPTTTAVLTCTTGYRSCPASLGGGCCPTDRECGSRICPASTTSTSTSTSTSTATSVPTTTPSEAPPVRPTSDAASSTPAITSTSATATACPQNFYACSAYYPGAGCCQVGRDCSSTSCPGRETSSVLASNGVTVVASPTTGVCASDWSSCPADVGGGCCPGGYACGKESCSATATASSRGIETAVAKQKENAAGRLGVDVGSGWMVMFAIGLLWDWGGY